SQLESAIEVAERGLEAHNFTDLWFNLGVAQMRRKDPASAAQAFYRALALRDDNQPYSRDLSISAWRAWLCLGAALQQVGDLEGARFAITEAHRAAPLERDVVIAAGAIAAMSGRPKNT